MRVKHTVLIVDDNLDLAENLREILEDEGHRAEVAGGGAEALARLESGDPVDLILTDLRMPGMNGVQMLRAVKARWPQTPVVVMTAFSRDALLDEAEAGGALDVLAKPVDLSGPDDLRLPGGRRRGPGAPGGGRRRPPGPAHPGAPGAHLAWCPTRRRTSPPRRRLLETVPFKAAIVDLRLPDGDGLAVGEALIRHPDGPIPVVYITGYRPDFAEALGGPGAPPEVALLEKPFRPVDLLGLVERVL